MQPKSNIFTNIPEAFDEELIETILDSDQVRIERIVSRGHASPDNFWYDQPQHEWVLVLQGEAQLRFKENNESVKLHPGDYVNIEPHTMHRVEWTAPDQETIWLAIHY